jgi:hypothetical protein
MRADATTKERITTTSPHRHTYSRLEGMEKLKSTTWLGRVVALQGLLGLVSHMSLKTQIANVILWELMAEQREFYDKLVIMEAALREQPKEIDPRWRNSPPDPIPASIFPFFRGEPDPKKHPCESRVMQHMAGTYLGKRLTQPDEDRREGATNVEAYVDAVFNPSYDIAHWLECAAHFFHVHFIRDKHNILWTASK